MHHHNEDAALTVPGPNHRLLADLLELGMTSSFVIWARTLRLAQAPLPHGRHDRRETERMVEEKVEALVESNLAMTRLAMRLQLGMVRSMFSLSPAPWLGVLERSAADAARLTAAGLRPYGRRTRANARRLAGPVA